MVKVIKAKILNPKASTEKSLVCFLVTPGIFLAWWLGTSFCIYFIWTYWKTCIKSYLGMNLPFC